MARADRPGVAGRGPRRLPHAGRYAQLPHAVDPLRRGGRRARWRRLPRSRREARRLPHLDRLRGARRAVPHTRGHRPRRGDPPRAGRPAPPAPRRRPARLHQGHQRAAARLRGAARRGADLGRRHGLPADRHAQPGTGGALHPAARRDRADRRPDQRRPQPDRPYPAELPAPVTAPGGADGVLPGRGRHARDPAARRHEPRGQGVRRLPSRRRGRARALRVHRCGPRADQRAAGEPA